MTTIAEMQSICGEVADLTTTSSKWKARVSAASNALGFTWSRTKDFYYGDERISPRLEEGDHARHVLAEIKARRKAAEIAQQLHATAIYLRTQDAHGHRHTIADLERAAAQAGVSRRPLAQTERVKR